jgi:hypothetical protein
MKRIRILDIIKCNPSALKRTIGMTIQNRSKMYNEICKINIDIDELRRATIIKGEALAFIYQFRENGVYVHCILKKETLKCRIKKESPNLDIPKNIIKERRLSLFGTTSDDEYYNEDYENVSFDLIQEETKHYGNKNKDCSDLDIPKNIIQERRASLIESVKNDNSKNKAPIGKLKRASYLAYLSSSE